MKIEPPFRPENPEQETGEKGMNRRRFLAGAASISAAFLAGQWLGHAGSSSEVLAAGSKGQESDRFIVDVMDYGADPSGKTDSSGAFFRALQEVEKRAAANPAGNVLRDPNRRGRASLYLPPGCYLVMKPEVLMRSSYRLRTFGLTIQGAGRGITQVLYANRLPGRSLLHNQDAWLFVTIADIEFLSTDGTNTFLYSYSAGGAQNYTFERCVWNGEWNEIFRLEGSDTNSEMTWFHCNFTGSIKRGVYVSGSKGSDQFLNYNFYACQFEVSEGDYLVFEKGGNINIWGGSLIYRDVHKGGTFFKLLNGPHAFGVQRFLCMGVRFELRSAASRLMECEWNDGTVTFISCDMASQAYRTKPSVQASFRSDNQKMPIIHFQNCQLSGKHEYRYRNGSWSVPHRVEYENCEFAQCLTADAFISFVNEDGVPADGAIGGRPVVAFRNCRSIDASLEHPFFDTELGYRSSNRTSLTKKLISIKTSEGGFPAAGRSEVFDLPLGSIVLGIRFLGKPGAITGSQTADYWVETAGSQPVRLAEVKGDPEGPGFNVGRDVYFECDNEQRRKLRLCAGAGQQQVNASALCLIEYIG